jgi:phosphate transport system substrate-binding protein
MAMKRITVHFLTIVICAALAIGADVTAKAQSPGNRSLRIGGAGLASGLVDRWVKDYQRDHAQWRAVVTGGNTGNGFKAFSRGELDVVIASRPISPMERRSLKAKGITIASKPVGRAAIAIITSPRNSVDSLTLDQLREIFSGETRTWGKVGGQDEPIRVLTRRIPDSGAAVLFQKIVLKGGPFSSKAIIPESWSSVILVCKKARDLPIGMAPATRSLEGTKVLGLKKDAASKAVLPTEENTRSGAYPLVGTILLYWNAKDKRVGPFADYCAARGARPSPLVDRNLPGIRSIRRLFLPGQETGTLRLKGPIAGILAKSANRT